MSNEQTYKNVKLDFNIEGLDGYVEQCVSTESTADKVVVNPQLLGAVLQMYVATGNMLDQIKKHIYYGSDYDLEKYNTTMIENFISVVTSLDALKPVIQNPNDDEIELPIDETMLRVLHSILGFATESTECVEAFLKFNETGEFDGVNIVEEAGDIGWYIAILHDALDKNMGDTFYTNAQKLAFRYKKGKFTMEDAEVRNLDGEREILES